MSSSSTTWTVDTNTKSGGAQTFSTSISSLKILGEQGGDAILRLFADEGDDNADQWRLVSSSSTNKLNFMSLASGTWSNVLDLFGSGTAASQYLALQTGNKLYLDGVGNTYLQESSADVLDIYVGGANMIKLTESTTDTVTITGDLTVGVDNTGHDVKFFGATASHYLLWDQSGDDLVLAGSTAVLSIDSTVDSSSTTTGSFHTDGGVGIAKKLYVGTDLDVDGTANLDVVDIDGAVDMASTLTLAGNADFNGDLDVDGTTNLDAVDIDGAVDMASTLTVAGTTALNDDITVAAGKKIYFDSTDTYIYSNADNPEDLVIGADADIILEPDGNVGIGTASPARLLHLHTGAASSGINIESNTGYATDIRFTDGGDSFAVGYRASTGNFVIADGIDVTGNERFVIAGSTGNVGIGTTSPISELDVSNASECILNVISHVTSSDGSRLDLRHSRNTTIGSHTAVSAADLLGQVNFIGSDGNSWEVGAKIESKAEETWDNDSAGAYLSFHTVDSGVDSQTVDERMRIDHNGNVGIGTTSPDTLLEVESSSSAGIQMLTTGGDTVSYFSAKNDAVAWQFRTDGGNSDNLLMYLDGTGAKMAIATSGNVGIGTTSPDGTLHIETANAGAITATAYADDLIIENDSHVGISLRCPDANDGYILFQSASNDRVAIISAEYNGGDENLAFAVDDDIKMTINDSGYVGIGTAAPDGTLHVETANAGAITAEAFADDLIIENNGTVGISIRCPDANRGTILFQSPAKDRIAAIKGEYNSGNEILQFSVDDDDKMTILDTGNVGIGTTSPAVDLDIEDTTTSSATQGGNLRLGSNDGAVMASGHRLGVLEFAGAEDTSSTLTVGARIEAVTDAIWSASENGAYLSFYITDGNASQTERFRLDNSSRISLSNNDSGGTGGSGSSGVSNNTVFGYKAGEDIASGGVDNTLIGHDAGKNITTGANNVVLGSLAGDALTTGGYHTLIGMKAGALLAAGQVLTNGTVAVGTFALGALTTGARNNVVGYNAMATMNGTEQ